LHDWWLLEDHVSQNCCGAVEEGPLMNKHDVKRATTSFGYCSSMASVRVWPHCVNARRIRCQADLNSFPLGELEETSGMPPYYMDEDYPAGPGIIQPLPE